MAAANETLSWSFGLRNHTGKYLTSETFGFRINCNGTSLKKKQIFFLEQQEDGKVFIRTHLDRYLTADAAGKFGGDAEQKGKNEMFEIEAQPDGKWALKSAYGYYTGGAGESLDAYTKVLAEDRLWTVQLAMHPQVAIRNVNRKRYVHLAGNVLNAEEDVPWGDDAMVTVRFFDEGKYALEASNGSFLSDNGELKSEATADCRYIIEFWGGQIALKGSNGKYVTAVGAPGTLKAAKQSVGKDELFIMEDSHPQVKLTAFNGRRVSVKTGVEVSASQDVVTDTEFFQMEINKQTKQWSFKTCKSLYWTMGDDGTISNNHSGERGPAQYFAVEWLGPKLAIKAANGKYVQTKKNGGLAATSASANEESTYTFEIINRPKLVLRGEHGFVGMLPSGLLECNKSIPEVFNLDVSKGVCRISGGNGKYWKVGPNGVTCTGSEPDLFHVQLLDHSRVLIMHGDKCLQGAQNGGFTCTGTKPDASTLWEY